MFNQLSKSFLVFFLWIISQAMKFFTGKGFPNPDVVHLYMAETDSSGLVEHVQVSREASALPPWPMTDRR